MVIAEFSLVDSNILILYVNRILPQHIKSLIDEAADDKLLFISDMTAVEVVSPVKNQPEAELDMDTLLSRITTIEVTSDVIALAKTLRRRKPSIQAADAIIAATALNYNLPLLSTDRHMKRLAIAVPEFKLVNPMG